MVDFRIDGCFDILSPVTFNPEVHHRRSIRLHGFDYSLSGAYFLTICTYERECLLVSEALVHAVQSEWRALPERFATVRPDEFVVMPNHVHGVLLLNEEEASAKIPLGQEVSAFKSLTAIQCNRMLGRAHRPFWQRNYFERVVRNDDEFKRVRQYIRDNTAKWAEDKNNPANVGRSS
ncbi:MAG: transposase [Chloroflexi bacterium]|nr:MAG: transposase [Chloroflexota bacterium]